MGRRPVSEACMFCSPDQACDMHTPKPKAVKPRKTAAKVTVPVEEPPAPVTPLSVDPPRVTRSPKADVHAAMRASIKASAAPAPPPVPAVTDTTMDDAIRALAPILHPIERRTYEAIINAPSSVKIRAARWRERVRGNA
jgi:hypothetical protein